MKSIELKDLCTGREYIVVYHKDDQWIPCIVKVVKEYTIKFVRPKDQTHSPLEFGKEYSINDFFHEYNGIDLFGNKFRSIWVWNNFNIACAWCDFQNSIDEYIIENNPF